MKRMLVLMSLALASSASATTLTVWSHFTNADEVAWLRAQTASYTRAAGHQVNIVGLPLDQIPDRLIQSAAKGQGPDLIVSLPQDRLGQLAAAGVIAPMERYVWSPSDLDRSVTQAMTYRGKLLALPMFAESVALVYNKKLVPRAPTSWNEFLRVAGQNTRDGRFGFLTDLSNAYANYGFFSAYGGYIFKESSGTLDVKNIGLANAGSRQAVSLLNDLRFKHGLVPEGITPDAAKSAFLDGRLAMLVTGPWDMGDIKKAGIDYGITTLPAPPRASGKWSPLVGVQGIVMNAYSKDKAAAGRLAQALVTSTAQVSFNRAGGRIPVSSKARTELKTDPVVTGFGKAISAGTPMPNVPEMGAVWGPWTNAVTQSTAAVTPDYAATLGGAVTEIRKSIK
ncbi:maltose ABC transporter substrate-binding protein [Deinococcus hopiensis]|uniref:Arabinogalactan oligomer / maltooligosaccharide transport system substrate-binding protein n=1 Tax=Deinococcus hopiensis KR-140 TaxID=695939 RepID=A0A1W1UKV9_9DEIO|nr:maltose ABC transporter substrate-binding protein [Deinococcus hopiensis]SMB81431.1 arabinogalactan oligomer / maltooligosaccharide transport system substrate-binding protein [Deinococcus hopiensis KR-140]